MRARRSIAAPVLPLLATLALALGMMLALAVSAPVGHAAPRAAMDPAGSISGVVTNGTHNGALAAGQQVTLRALVLSHAPHDAGTTTTDAHGHFAFGGLDTSGETTYEVYTHYQGGFFVTAPVSFGGSAATAQTANLTIYDTTTDMSALRVSNLTLLVSTVNKAKGLIPIGAFYTFANTGTHAIVGSLTAPANGASGGMPQGILRFALPASAANLTLGAGFGDAQTIQISGGFAATATIPPGPASFAFAFDLPYTGSAATLPLSALYPTDRLTLLAPPAYHLTAPDFAADTPITANGQQLQQLHVDNLAAGASRSVALAALPEAGVDPDLYFGQVLPIAGVLALLLALLLWLFARRGNLGALARLAGQSRAGRKVARRLPTPAQARNTSRQRLLDALLDLDERHAAGAIGDAAYERQHTDLRGELRALLAASSTPTSAAPSPRGGRPPDAPTASPAPGSRGGEAGLATIEPGSAIPAASSPRRVGAGHVPPVAPGGEDPSCAGRGEASLAPTISGQEAADSYADADGAGTSDGRPADEGDSVGASGGRPARDGDADGTRTSGGRPPARATTRSAAGATSRSVRARRSRAPAGGGR